MIGENRHLADNATLNKHRKAMSEATTRERRKQAVAAIALEIFTYLEP